MKTIKVKIALEVNPDGEWHAYGWHDAADWDEAMDGLEPLQGHHTQRLYVTADVPVPAAEPATVTGEAVPA